jgi:hypothetical protein
MARTKDEPTGGGEWAAAAEPDPTSSGFGPPSTTRADGRTARTAPEPPPVKRVARRTQVVVRRVGPWSVLKFSLLFYFCVMLILYFAMLIIYLVLSASGAIGSLESLLGLLDPQGTYGSAPVQIDGKQVFTYLLIAGIVLTVVWALINMFVAFLYNLTSDIVGGIEITLAEKTKR